jgi:SAM-dependent methyltransferase
MGAEFDPYADDYDKVLGAALGTAGETDRFAGYKIDEMAYRLDASSVRRVLDFGCGVGRSLPFLAGAFPRAEVWGFDPSERSARAAGERVPGAHVVADWSAVEPASFDCILAANVFHHVPPVARPDQLARCRSLLVPGGSLFVFEHNPYNPLTRRVFDRCPFDRDAQMIASRDMVRLGCAAGLRVGYRAYTLFLPFRGRIVASVHRALGWLPLGAQYYVQFLR